MIDNISGAAVMGRTKDLVEWILRHDEKARGDDRYLIFVFYKIKYPQIMSLPFRDVMLMGGMTSFESIRRCRQKLQEQNPELKPDDEGQKARDEWEYVMREFARYG